MDRQEPSVLIVDDNKDNLTRLAKELEERLPDYKIEIWQPVDDELSPEEVFDQFVGEKTELVVTDYDLTTTLKGMFGLAVVAWCQSRSIPVGEYSRLPGAAMPVEPNLFELRVPIEDDTTADFVAGVVRGFHDLRMKIEANLNVVNEGGSLAQILASILDRPDLESQFSAYMSQPNAANSFLVGSLKKESSQGDVTKSRLFSYVLGHILINSVLKYPGPILSGEMLCAYLTINSQSFARIEESFESARYIGPFSEGKNLYWRDDVDHLLDSVDIELTSEDFESIGDFNRRVVEVLIEGEVPPHKCVRCEGRKGGFWCPFTNRAVCERADCSVPGSSWIPAGAQLCRIERDFFDEWSPILSL